MPLFAAGTVNAIEPVLGNWPINTSTTWQARLLPAGITAGEVCGVVCVPGSFVNCRKGIGTQRARGVHCALGGVRRYDFFRRSIIFAPLLERPERVEDIGARAALAMFHPRHHE